MDDKPGPHESSLSSYGSVAVLSPHLDDAALSLGAAIARAAADRQPVRVVTVMSGDPRSDAPANHWDRLAGFATEGEASRARGLEDDAACRLLGAEPMRLGYGYKEYSRGGEDSEIVAAIRIAVDGFDAVLLPGFPLVHEDHAWLNQLVLAHDIGPAKLGLYAEQPYAAGNGKSPSHDFGSGTGWIALKAGPGHQLTKLRACRAYSSQVPLLGGTKPLLGILSYEVRRGGELICWPGT
jgi:LmbE family N-acetylglucosaminyl deacetylase